MYGYSKYKEPPRFKFEHNEKSSLFYFAASHYTVINLCKSLYEKKIRFKEFVYDKRCFIGKRQTKKEIQKLDEAYNINW